MIASIGRAGRNAHERGAKWAYPGSGGRVAVIDPVLIEIVKEHSHRFIHSDPRVLELLHSIDGIDEPSNGAFAIFSLTRRPEMQEALAESPHRRGT